MIKLSELYIFFRYLDRKVGVVLIGILLILPFVVYYGNQYDNENNDEIAFWENKISLGVDHLSSAMVDRSTELSSISSKFRSHYYPIVNRNLPIERYEEGFTSQFYSSNMTGFYIWRNQSSSNIWGYHFNSGLGFREDITGMNNTLDGEVILTKFNSDLNLVPLLHSTGKNLDESILEITIEALPEVLEYDVLSILWVGFRFKDNSMVSFYSVQSPKINVILIVIEYVYFKSPDQSLVYRGNFTGNFVNFVDTVNNLIDSLG